MRTRLTFLSHFCLCLACAAAAFFAWRAGVFATVWANDASMMTSAIAALFVGTAIWLGRQSWLVDSGPPDPGFQFNPPAVCRIDASFGDLAERLAVLMGLVGTAIGLSLQAKALASGGGASFLALATSLYTTATGGTAAAIIAAMTFSLKRGIDRRG